jgi:stalled ribosome rescue protein Dom34
MKNSKKIAIYLDHSQAILFDFDHVPIEFKTIESEFDYQDKIEILQKGESHLHNKEQNLQHKYYKSLGDEILNYHQVLLFGPTDAKTELFNYLTEIKKFEKIKIKVKTSDKLTENQQLEFINNNFSESK